MMNSTPHNISLEALMADYAAPVPDFGFSDQLLKKVYAQRRLKGRLVSGACFAAGVVMSSQFNSLKALLSGVKLETQPRADLAVPFQNIMSALTDGLSQMSAELLSNNIHSSPAMTGSLIMFTGLIIWLAKDAIEGQI